ncbi:MAG: preprotein translocase subunit SecG [Rhodocyclaceae bacterium]|nr:preprotein translocase subunit SecG [Rhodocyclaceae bacterium]
MNGLVFGLLLTLHIMVGLGIIVLVLLQHGKGADMGAAFGSGASGSLFGATGSANFLSRTTAVLAAVFFVTSLSLTAMHNVRKPPSSVLDTAPATLPAPATPAAPAADGGGQSAPDSKIKEIPK